MTTSTDFKMCYPFETAKNYQLHTKEAALELIEEYRKSITLLYQGYMTNVYDTQIGLVKEHIHLSSSLDMKIRSSAFYDNVIFWKTTQLAGKLGIIVNDPHFLQQLKDRILNQFWYKEKGYFLDDLADDKGQKAYSPDWLVAFMTGFLSPFVKTELGYFEKSVSYIKQEKLDKPFPLKMKGTTDNKSHWIVKATMPDYQINAIWSNWGQQYTKLVCILYKVTGKKEYLIDAQLSVKLYEENILKYGGYPEVYHGNGKMMKSILYRSILQTGWVVDFEHSRSMVDYYTLK